MIDHAISVLERFTGKSLEAKSVARHTNRERRGARRSPIDDRIADEQRVAACSSAALGEMQEARRVRLARKRSIAADDRVFIEELRKIEAGEDTPRRGERLVR